MDSEIEADIQRAVAVLMAGRTTIAIAHRLSTIVAADEILVLHHGEVVERGAHADLLEQRGQYERLFRLEIGSAGGSGGGGAGVHPGSSGDGSRLPTAATCA